MSNFYLQIFLLIAIIIMAGLIPSSTSVDNRRYRRIDYQNIDKSNYRRSDEIRYRPLYIEVHKEEEKFFPRMIDRFMKRVISRHGTWTTFQNGGSLKDFQESFVYVPKKRLYHGITPVGQRGKKLD